MGRIKQKKKTKKKIGLLRTDHIWAFCYGRNYNDYSLSRSSGSFRVGQSGTVHYIYARKRKKENLKFSQIPLTNFFILPYTPVFSCFVLTM